MIKANIILASTNTGCKPIYTVVCTYNRYIHGEVMTHRMFSRNAMSSRAVPVKKVLAQVWNDPAMPVHWGANQPGMQARYELGSVKKVIAKQAWKLASKAACVFAWTMMKVGLSKQVANRVLEPWQWMTTIITATEWDNFFELRCHPDAQPEFQVLAEKIRIAMHVAVPQKRQWHIPFVTDEEIKTHGHKDALKLSAARCARVSYLTHDGKVPSYEADIKLYDRLVGSAPIHASPVEHQALAAGKGYISNNFRDWYQYRDILQNGDLI